MLNQKLMLKVMSIGDILDYSIEVYKDNFKKFAVLALLFYVPVVVFNNFASGYLYMDFYNSSRITDVESIDKLFYTFLAYYISLGILGILNVIYSLTIKSVMDAAVIEIAYNHVTFRKAVALKDAVKGSFKRLPSMIGYNLLYGLILFGIGVASVFILYVLLLAAVLGVLSSVGTKGVNENYQLLIFIFVLLVFIVLIVCLGLAAAYIAVRYMFGIHSITVEGSTMTGGFSRSSMLSSKNFWHIALTFFLGYMLFFGLPQVLSIALSFIMQIDRNLYFRLLTVVNFLSSLLYPFIVILTTMIFINLKIKKEGLDLEIKVDMLLEGQGDNGQPDKISH